MERRTLFLSHASPDDNEFVAWLGARLAAEGYEVWADVSALGGGERFWPDIERVLRDRTAIFLVAISKNALQRDGVNKEIQMACGVERTLKQSELVVPLRIDGTAFGDFPIMLIDRNGIDFEPGWAQGLAKLRKLLEKRGIPKTPVDQSSADGQWWAQFWNQPRGELRQSPEDLLTNEYSFIQHPTVLRVWPPHAARLMPLQDREAADFALVMHAQSVCTFADDEMMRWAFPSLPAAARSAELPLSSLAASLRELNAKTTGADAAQIYTKLIRAAWDKCLQARGLSIREFASARAWHLPDTEENRGYHEFTDPFGRKAKRYLMGKAGERRWAVGMSARPIRTPRPLLRMRPQVVLFEANGTPMDFTRLTLRRRKALCKTWWSAKWRDLSLAFMAHVAQKQESIELPIASGERLELAATPSLLVAPLSITGDYDMTQVESPGDDSDMDVDNDLAPGMVDSDADELYDDDH